MHTLFGQDSPQEQRDAALMAAYESSGRTLDDLPYTPEFEQIFATAGGEAVWGSRKEAFRRLHNLRKRGGLARLGRSGSGAIKVSRDEETLVCELVIGAVGSLGQRDQLPFDAQLDALNLEFGNRTGRQLSQYDFWRLIAKVAK